MSRRVVIAYKTLPAYRLEFFDKLRTRLGRREIGLDLIYGNPYGQEGMKRDTANLDWAEFRPNRFISVGGRHGVWQPILGTAIKADLVIVEQASRLLANYPLLAAQVSRLGPPIALWGHGANLQSRNPAGLSERFKSKYSRLPHWWFAYTEQSKQRVQELGFPDEKITVVQNAIDTKSLAAQISAIEPEDVSRFLSRYGARPGSVGLFIGSLYQDKRLDFLIDSVRRMKEADANFSLFIAGDGPLRDWVQAQSNELPFVHYLGRLDGRDRALALRASDLVLMPGLVGLAILDAFAGGAPLITTDISLHSPEIEYLEPGLNGLILSDPENAQSYADAVVSLLRDNAAMREMRRGCKSAAERYTTEAMVSRFASGVEAALR